jgi:tetratricopeptide (TPR) repeat protein
MVKTELSDAQIGRLIHKVRRKMGLSQEELAGDRYTAAYVSHVEHGRRHASQEALTFFAERLGLTYEHLVTGRDPADDIRLEVEIERAVAMIHNGEPAEALELLEGARAEAERVGTDPPRRRAEEGIALALFRQGRLEESLAAYQRLGDRLIESPPEDLTRVVVGCGRCLFQLAKLHDALDVLEPHLFRLLRSPAPDPTALLQVYAALIPVYFDLGKTDKAKDAAKKGSEVASEVADPEQLACLFINRAGLLLEQDQTREALTFLARAQDMYAQLGWKAEAAKVAVARGMALIDREEFDRAAAAFSSVVEDEGDTVTPRDRARALIGLAQIYRRTGEPGRGLDSAKVALSLIPDVPAEAAEVNREAGMCALEVGDEKKAMKYWKTAISLYKTVGDNPEMARTAKLIGGLLERQGDTAAAVRVYREGLDGLQEVR